MLLSSHGGARCGAHSSCPRGFSLVVTQNTEEFYRVLHGDVFLFPCNHTHPLDPSPTTGCLSVFCQFLPSSSPFTVLVSRVHPSCRNSIVCLPTVPFPPGAAPQAVCFLLLSSTPPGTPSVRGTRTFYLLSLPFPCVSLLAFHPSASSLELPLLGSRSGFLGSSRQGQPCPASMNFSSCCPTEVDSDVREKVFLPPDIQRAFRVRLFLIVTFSDKEQVGTFTVASYLSLWSCA